MNLHRLYQPLSAIFGQSDVYFELAPCSALAPYIRCFWGTANARHRHDNGSLVIPDTCMDLIFEIDYTENRVRSHFCALDDAAYITAPVHSNALCATFGVRFYAWSAVCFAEDSLADSMRSVTDPRRFFPKLCRAIEPVLPDLPTLGARARYTESVLMRLLQTDRLRPDVLNAIHAMIVHHGHVRMKDVAAAACLSERQMERILRTATGTPPKLMADLIRHQLVYRELVEGRFRPLDAVERFGYADQSHLIRDFRRFHSMTPMEALNLLRKR